MFQFVGVLLYTKVIAYLTVDDGLCCDNENREVPNSITLRHSSFYDDYTIESEIGDGSFGTVFKCKEKRDDSNGSKAAAKFLTSKTKLQKTAVENEIDILCRIQHNRIARLYNIYQNSPIERVIVMELIEGGQLLDRIVDDHFILSEKAIRSIVRQLCEALEHIHQRNIIHLDIKPENVMCTSRSGNRIKLIDFGVAKLYHPEKGQELRAFAGTAEFSAPEVVNYENIDFSSDMWSLGVLCYLLLSGLSPFLGKNDCETYFNVSKGQWTFGTPFTTVSHDAKCFISSLLIIEKHKRLTASQCLEHEWMKTSNKNFNTTILIKENHILYLARRRWKKGLNCIVAIKRMGYHIGQKKIEIE